MVYVSTRGEGINNPNEFRQDFTQALWAAAVDVHKPDSNLSELFR